MSLTSVFGENFKRLGQMSMKLTQIHGELTLGNCIVLEINDPQEEFLSTIFMK